MALIFSLDLSRTQKDNKFKRAGKIFELVVSGGEYLNAAFLSVTVKLLKMEMKEHDGLLVGDYEDTYFNLTI